MCSLFCSFENSVTEETHKNWLKNGVFSCSAHIICYEWKKKIHKKPLRRKEKKAWNKLTKPFPNKWKSKLAKSDKGSYYITIIGIGIIITIN